MTDFDWVTARSACSLGVIFEMLKKQIADDVQKCQSMLKGPPYTHGFRFKAETRTISVIVDGSGILEALHFILTDSSIEVRDGNRKVLTTATPTLCDDGECRLKINGEEKELWQFRKIALEDLLFASYQTLLSRATL